MFFEKYKEKAAYKILKKKLLQLAVGGGAVQEKGIASVACLVDLDDFDDMEALLQLSDSLNIAREQFSVLGFTRREDAYEETGGIVIRKTDLGWRGKIRHPQYSEIKEGHYDLLLNYYGSSCPMLALASTEIRSSFRAGLPGVYEKLNHLTVNVSPDNFPEFKKELIKYLIILNKI